LIPTEYRADADLYQHNSLVATGHIDKGAIVSAAGDSAWASSSDFQVQNLVLQPDGPLMLYTPSLSESVLTLPTYSSSPRR
jgi:hypothetical protein